jgi:hypothetical protein
MNNMEKRCGNCERVLPLTEFYKGNGKFGKKTHCKECMKKASRENHENNRDKRTEQMRKYHKDNRDRELARARRWREKNHEHVLAAARKYREDNIENRLEYERQYREDNRESRLEHYRHYYAENSDAINKRKRKTNAENPDKSRSRNVVTNAIRNNELPPAHALVCEGCQEAQAQEYHHFAGYDPENALAVEALCRECHGLAHRREI